MWLKLTLETMRADDVADRRGAVEAEERLVGWVLDRERTSPAGSDGRSEASA